MHYKPFPSNCSKNIYNSSILMETEHMGDAETAETPRFEGGYGYAIDKAGTETKDL